MPPISAHVTLPKAALERIFENLRASGFAPVGPRVRDGAIVLEELQRPADLPVGWTDEQNPGSYKLHGPLPEGRYFDYNCGPQSWKRFLNPPRQKILSAVKENGTWKFQAAGIGSGVDSSIRKYAFIGVRACELHAIGIQDRVFAGADGNVRPKAAKQIPPAMDYQDPLYTERRRRVFILAVNCSRAAPTCFCTSMKTGPRVSGAFDLALTETADRFVVEIGSEAGSHMLEGTTWQPASAFDLQQAFSETQRAEEMVRKRLDTHDLPRLLYENLEHRRWDEVAARCLSCANCTMVCPTCFCSTVEESSDLRGEKAERTRLWDSCFVLDFSHVHGGNIRPTVRARYRQWLTHKFASWIDQFGTSGCVGCGRCITWCPVGIDVTEEIKAIRSQVVP
jgi:formate hydrogenlyase subunit 6/NADH:ubiquinone oxidoreductase subunit I